jgi:hypothetical protein
MSMAQSVDHFMTSHNEVTFYLFTDQPGLAEDFSPKLINSKLIVNEVPAWKWPEVALKRYEVIHTCITNLNKDYVVYIDADMLALSIIPRVEMLINKSRVAITYHPGFWRPAGFKKFLFYFLHPLVAVRDVRMQGRIGGLGAWETSTASAAFVPRSLRKSYFCGGFWLGETEAIFELCKSLMEQTRLDMKAGVEAQWLDESHLNKWAAMNPNAFTSLTPEYCFDKTYPQLGSLVARIEAVNKSKNPVGDWHE